MAGRLGLSDTHKLFSKRSEQNELEHERTSLLLTVWNIAKTPCTLNLLTIYATNTHMTLKEESDPTYVTMLCKRLTNMLNYFLNACVKKWKILSWFLFVNLMNIHVWIPKILITMKNWQSLSLGNFFSLVKPVAAKVIRQHMFFFTLTYFFINTLEIMIKDHILNQLFNIFTVVLTTQTLFPWFQIFTKKLYSVWALKTFCVKRWLYFRLYAQDWESGTFSELSAIGTFCRCAMAEKKPRQHFCVHFS